MERFELDISAVTPEAYHDEKREALHVFNVHLLGDESRSRVVKFVSARVLHSHQHLPSGSSQRVLFDVRGQHISGRHLESTRQAIVHAAARHGISASVEFLTN